MAKPSPIVKKVASCFSYFGALPELTAELPALAFFPEKLQKALRKAQLQSERGSKGLGPLKFESFFALYDAAERQKPIAYAAFAAQRSVNYTVGKIVAVTTDGKPLCALLAVGD